MKKNITIATALLLIAFSLPHILSAEIEVKHKYLTKKTHIKKNNTSINKDFSNRLRDLTISENNSGLKFITVKPGDSFLMLLKKYNLSLKDFAQINNLSAPYKLLIGQRLKLPSSKIYKVRKGEDLEGIAWLYNLSLQELYKINNFPVKYKVKAGELIKIPTDLVKKNNTGDLFKDKKYDKIKIIWPLKGKVVTKYGLLKSGVKSEGINIAAKLGEKIKASAAGHVVYVNKEGLGGLGNIIIIEHPGGWFSTYAHLGEILVENGDDVTLGELIAKAGNTGSITKPQLYFGLRKEQNMVNPQKYLP